LTAAGGGWCVEFDHDECGPFFAAVFDGYGGGCGCDLVFCGRAFEGGFHRGFEEGLYGGFSDCIGWLGRHVDAECQFEHVGFRNGHGVSDGCFAVGVSR